MPADIKNLKDWRFEIDFEGIAWATFDCENQSMNTIGRRPTEELDAIITAVEDAAAKGDVKGLIFLSAKDNNFIAGADIREFENMKTAEEATEAVTVVIDIFDRMEKLRVPVVAAIHGFCLGGGLEFALACHYRIADREEGTRLGLPEVKLGIIPGLHGSVRWLRQGGPMGAMPNMLAGRMLRPGPARAAGIVDQLVPTHHSLRWAARTAVLRKKKSRPAGGLKKLMLIGPVRKLLAGQMRKQTAAKVREDHYPAPFRLIELFEKYGDDQNKMRDAETRYFAPLMASETSRNLRRVFQLTELLKSQAPKSDFKPMRAHVIGAGTMGGDIAAWCVISGMQVSLQDLDEVQIEKARKRAKSLFRKRLRKKPAVDAAMERLIADKEGKHIPRADVVIEAIAENLDIKRKVFKALEPKLKQGAVLATNTSSLPIEDIAKPLDNPGRLIGLHFFNPVAKMPLVEVVAGPDSNKEEIEKGCAVVTQIKKFPVITKSKPGFLVNRVLAPYLMAAITRHLEGVPKEKIDEAMERFGMPMGPIELTDVVGLDIGLHVAEILGLASDSNSEFNKMVADGKLGKKTGQGFYKWVDGKPQKNDMEFDDRELNELGLELIRPMLDECEKCRDEKIVDSADLVDAGVIFGTGFAPFRGGPLHYRASLNEDEPVRSKAAE